MKTYARFLFCVILHLALPLLQVSIVQGQSNFDRNVVGVGFSPYVDPEPWRNWDQYSVDDLKKMLKVIHTKFHHISTYSMGVQQWCANGPWDKCDSNALIARAAAQSNAESRTRFKVNIGVYQNANYQQKEIDNAFLAAADANGISKGTVWGITFTNEYVVSPESGQQVLNMIRQNKQRAKQQGLKVGARIHTCGAIKENSAFGNVIKDIVRESDFIYCNVYASKEHARLGAARAAQEVGYYINGLVKDFKAVKSNIDFRIGETGWPSAENSFNDSENTVPNLVEYWRGINEWAKKSKIQTQMFQAFNEYWKGKNSEFKAESHYGWWYKPNNNRQEHIYVEKETNRRFG